MLFDNALPPRPWLHAFHGTGKPLYRDIAEETLDYCSRELTSPEGGLCPTRHARGKGAEGKRISSPSFGGGSSAKNQPTRRGNQPQS
jgi:uncharacterized protein YyaL (SSP411 family)